MKKIITLLLSFLMMASVAGCSSSSGGTTSGGSASTGSEEVPVLKFALSTLSVVPSLDATQKVEDQLNEYLASIGENYKIDLTIISISDYLTNIPMELAGGTDCSDIIQVFSLASFVDQGYIIDLSQYLDTELKPTAELIGNVMGSGNISGGLYMVPRYFGTVLDWKWIYNKTLIEESGVDISGVNSLETLEPVLAQLKEVYPDEYFLVYTDQFDDLYNYYTHTSTIGTYTATVGNSTTLVNLYETEAFKKGIETARRFRLAGYADPEGSANTKSHDAVVMDGTSKGVIMGHSADCEATAELFNKMNTYGAEFAAVSIGISDLYTDTLGVGISYTCKYPDEAASFINLLYTDYEVWTRIIYGAEGQDYVWDEAHEYVDYPEGLDANTIPYNCAYSCGMIGNGFQSLPFKSNSTGSNSGYGQHLMETAWCPPLYGFTPTSTNVFNEATAISNVVEQYVKVLTYGDVDIDEVYPQFLQALKDAGIDKLIADYQEQANAWLAANGK